MQIDLFYELAAPASLGRSDAQIYHETLEELALADLLGFDGAWIVEHHFMREYSHAPSPETFLAAASQRTRRMRLGHAVIVLPFNHPVRVAERCAALDLLCEGRLEIGIGRGFSPREYAVFGANMKDSRAHMQEGLAILRAAPGGPFSHHGELYNFDEIEILPKPFQNPHPPIWTAAVSPHSIAWAAEQAIGVLAGPFKPWIMLRHDIASYRRGWARAHPHGAPKGANYRFAITVGCICLDDGAEARRRADGLCWYYQRLLDQTRPLLEKLRDSYGYYYHLRFLEPLLRRAVTLPMLEAAGLVVVGTPEECRRGFERYRRGGVDRLILAIGAGTMPSDLVRRSLHCIAEKVLPSLSESRD